MRQDRRTSRTNALRLCAAALLLAACGGGAPPSAEGDASMRVDPGAAMDTTPAGTPAPPGPDSVRDDP